VSKYLVIQQTYPINLQPKSFGKMKILENAFTTSEISLFSVFIFSPGVLNPLRWVRNEVDHSKISDNKTKLIKRTQHNVVLGQVVAECNMVAPRTFWYIGKF